MPAQSRSRSGAGRLVRGALLLNLTYASELAIALLDEELRDEGIRPVFAGLLTEIRLAEPVTPTALARRTAIAPATLYDYVERMVAEGLVERVPNERDRRSYHLRTTKAGVRRVHAVSDAVRRVHQRFLDGLDVPLAEVEDAVADLRFALEDALNAGATD